MAMTTSLNAVRTVKIRGRGIGIVIHMTDTLNNTRYGQADIPSLRELFVCLQCDIRTYLDPNNAQVITIINNLKREINSNPNIYHYLLFVFIGHGNRDQGTEREYLALGDNSRLYVEDLYKMFSASNCQGLVGKLKAFFLQACRGRNVDSPVAFPAAISLAPAHRSQYSDFYILCPSFMGHYSYYDTRSGKSHFIQELCQVYIQHYQQLDIQTMGLIVKDNLSRRVIDVCLNDGSIVSACHCVTEISTLCLRVYFPSPQAPVLPQAENVSMPRDISNVSRLRVFLELSHNGASLGRMTIDLDPFQYPRRVQLFAELCSGAPSSPSPTWCGATFTSLYNKGEDGERVWCTNYIASNGSREYDSVPYCTLQLEDITTATTAAVAAASPGTSTHSLSVPGLLQGQLRGSREQNRANFMIVTKSNLSDTSWGAYPVLGQVVHGMDMLRTAIDNCASSSIKSVTTAMIFSITAGVKSCHDLQAVTISDCGVQYDTY